MGLSFLSAGAKRRDELLAIDLGGRTTKAVHLTRKGDRLGLARFALVDAPIYEKNLSVELLAEHLKAVCKALETKTRTAAVAIGVQDSIVRQAELPVMPVPDMRQMLKMSAKMYLQQELPGYVYDCFPLTNPGAQKKPEKPKATSNLPKQRMLVAGARNQLVENVQAAMKSGGLHPDHVVPGLIGPVNAFEQAFPELYSKEVVALVEIGFKNTSICILDRGDLALSRVVAIGSDKLTNGLAESLGISYAEAEGIKIGMPQEVQPNLETLVLPLGRELRASLDFFEHQHDKPVTHIFVSGGAAKSEVILQILQAELLSECKTWNPLGFLQFDLPPQQVAEVDQVAPQLAVAVGAGLAAF